MSALENVIPSCSRCGEPCNNGWVDGPYMSPLCRDCYYGTEFKEIEKQAKANARPWELLFYGWVVIFVGLAIRLVLTVWNMIV